MCTFSKLLTLSLIILYLPCVSAGRYYSSSEIKLIMSECGQTNTVFLERHRAYRENDSESNLERLREARTKLDALECGIPLDNLYWALSAGVDLVCGVGDDDIVRALFTLIVDTPNSASEIPSSSLSRMMECQNDLVIEVFVNLSDGEKQQYLDLIKMTEKQFLTHVMARASRGGK